MEGEQIERAHIVQILQKTAGFSRSRPTTVGSVYTRPVAIALVHTAIFHRFVPASRPAETG